MLESSGAKPTDVNQQLEQIVEGRRFWFSPDIETAEDVLLEPLYQTYVPIRIPHYLPDLGYIPYEQFQFLSAHTRSRYAQIGLEVPVNTGMLTAVSLEDEFPGTREGIALLPVANIARRPILLQKGDAFFNFYKASNYTLDKNEVEYLLGQEILIDGVLGVDWQYWEEGIELFLDENKVLWIPPASTPIRISPEPLPQHNRTEVDQYLQQIPEHIRQMNNLWIGETRAQLTLSTKVHAVIECLVGNEGYQTNSPVLRGGHTHSRIRTEIYSITIDDKRPRSIRLRFFKG